MDVCVFERTWKMIGGFEKITYHVIRVCLTADVTQAYLPILIPRHQLTTALRILILDSRRFVTTARFSG
jgi:hypothetical protein